MKRTTDDVDFDLAHRRAGEALAAMSREDALDMAVKCCRAPELAWVRRARLRGVLQAKCLGMFRLLNGDRPDLPWPSALFVCGVLPQDGGPLVCSLALYLSPDGDWTVVADEPVELAGGERRLVIAWGQYAGDRDGPPGLLNGDDAAGEPVRRTGPPVSPPASPRGTPPPSPSSGSRGGAARPSRGRSGGSRRGRTTTARPAAAAAASPQPTRPSRLELLVELLRRLD